MRRKSVLMEIGDAAMRKALLATLIDHNWNLTHTATMLRMTGPADVIRSIKRLGLSEAYETARALKPTLRQMEKNREA